MRHHGGAVSPLESRERANQIISVLRSNNVEVLNTTGVLVKNDQQTRMYHLYDIHFTMAGNQAVTDYALPLIQQRVLSSVPLP